MAFIYSREAKILARAESEIANWADASFAVTPSEAAIFNARADMKKYVGWFSNGVDTEYFDPSAAQSSAPPVNDCVFVGAMDYRANVDGVLYFAKHVWPLVRQQHPQARFAIVGANPARAVKSLEGENGVTVTGRVDDVRPWLAGAKTVIAPLRVARGVQNKVLEAMSMAKPVVASREAMTGIEAPEEAAIAADRPDDMAAAISLLLKDGGRRRAMGAAARSYVLETHQWEQTLTRLDDALRALGV